MLDMAGQWRVEAPDIPAADAAVAGQPIAAARALLEQARGPYHAAQMAAFDLATGRRPDAAAQSREMRREHLTQIFMAWPHALGLRPTFDQSWLTDDDRVMRALFGAPARVPTNDFDTAGYLGSEDGIAPLLRLIGDLFGPRTAVADGLPLIDADTAFRPAPVENSCAARQAASPAMDYVEAMYGRGPLWRATGRVVDLARMLTAETPPRPVTIAPGQILAPSARGYVALRIETEGERVTSFARVTPSDHLLAKGGALEVMLARLPAERGGLVPLLMTLIDPCRPVSVEPVRPPGIPLPPVG